jgi:hypothetical protein
MPYESKTIACADSTLLQLLWKKTSSFAYGTGGVSDGMGVNVRASNGFDQYPLEEMFELAKSGEPITEPDVPMPSWDEDPNTMALHFKHSTTLETACSAEIELMLPGEEGKAAAAEAREVTEWA